MIILLGEELFQSSGTCVVILGTNIPTAEGTLFYSTGTYFYDVFLDCEGDTSLVVT